MEIGARIALPTSSPSLTVVAVVCTALCASRSTRGVISIHIHIYMRRAPYLTHSSMHALHIESCLVNLVIMVVIAILAAIAVLSLSPRAATNTHTPSPSSVRLCPLPTSSRRAGADRDGARGCLGPIRAFTVGRNICLKEGRYQYGGYMLC